MTIRSEVLWFAEEMEKKLAENDHKEHWSNCYAEWLIERLLEEVEELKSCLERLNPYIDIGNSSKINEIIREAADVANFAMMIADNASEGRL